MVPCGGHGVRGRVVNIRLCSRLFNHILNVGSPCFNNFDHGLGRVIDLNPLLAPLHEDLLGHIWLSNEHFGVVTFNVVYQVIVAINDLLQLTQVQFLLSDPGSQVIVLLGGLFSVSDCLHALL